MSTQNCKRMKIYLNKRSARYCKHQEKQIFLLFFLFLCFVRNDFFLSSFHFYFICFFHSFSHTNLGRFLWCKPIGIALHSMMLFFHLNAMIVLLDNFTCVCVCMYECVSLALHPCAYNSPGADHLSNSDHWWISWNGKGLTSIFHRSILRCIFIFFILN